MTELFSLVARWDDRLGSSDAVCSGAGGLRWLRSDSGVAFYLLPARRLCVWVRASEQMWARRVLLCSPAVCWRTCARFKGPAWVFTVRGWQRKASEESNHLLTARHDWKYAKYNPRNRGWLQPIGLWRGRDTSLRFQQERDRFLWAELNDKITSSDTYNESLA